jgi:hypothetical protein
MAHCMVVAIGLSVLTAHTAVRIEVCNRRAGKFLPRTDSLSTGQSKWRNLPWDTNTSWVQFLGPKDADGNPVSRPLTPDERDQMRREVDHATCRNQLRSAVSTWGVIQYPAVLLQLLCSLTLLLGALSRGKKVLGAAGTILAVISAILMFYRGYFSSLGW